MSSSLTVVGRLTRDPDLRYTSNGKSVTNFAVAYDMGWGDHKHPVFLECTVWGKQGESLEQRFRKGDGVVLHGELDLHTWEQPQTNAKKQRHEMQVRSWSFPPKGPDQRPDHGGEPAAPAMEYGKKTAAAGTADFLDDGTDNTPF